MGAVTILKEADAKYKEALDIIDCLVVHAHDPGDNTPKWMNKEHEERLHRARKFLADNSQ